MEKVNDRLDEMSAEDLRELLARWASEVQPDGRYEFLARITALPVEEQDLDEQTEEELLGEIAAFAKRVADGDYCEGWGWDAEIGEERDWGDESWAEEMDELFLQARRLLFQGNSKLAETVYKKLFEILAMGEESGHLPGDPDYENLLDVELKEQVALLIRAIYLNAVPTRRPEQVFASIQKHSYLANGILLSDIVNANDTALPEWDSFLPEWIAFLQEQPARQVSELLREAISLQGGIGAIAEFARRNSQAFPAAYLNWIGELEKSGDEEAIISVAREALTAIPRDYAIRSDVAVKLVQLGEKRNDAAMQLEGYRHCFAANPGMGWLLELYSTAIAQGCFEEVRSETAQRVLELQAKQKERLHVEHWNSELRVANVSDKNVAVHVLLFGGNYAQVLALCKDQGSLGWSGGQNPKPALIAFILSILTGEKLYSPLLSRQLADVLADRFVNYKKGDIEQYRQIIAVSNKLHPIAKSEMDSYVKWCIDETGKRVDAIVSNQYRGSYGKAANLLAAMAEGLCHRGEKHEAMALLEKYRSKYSRHRSFQSELAAAKKSHTIIWR